MSNSSEKREVVRVDPLRELELELKKIEPGLFKGMTVTKKQQLLKSVSVSLVRHKSHSGPIPDPESLAEYNEIIPNGAERIMTMTEGQQSHRFELEKSVVLSNYKQSGRGQIFALIIAIVLIGSGTVVALLASPTAGATIIGTSVVGLAGVFLIGKSRQGD